MDPRKQLRADVQMHQADAVEDFDVDPARDDQSFHDVETVQFGPSGGDVGQIPASRRHGPTDASASIERPAAFQDADDGAHRRHRGNSINVLSLEQRAMNRRSAELAQVAPVSQLPAQLQD